MSYIIDSYSINYDGGLTSNVMLRKLQELASDPGTGELTVEPWAWYRSDDLDDQTLNADVTFWLDRTGNGRDLHPSGSTDTKYLRIGEGVDGHVSVTSSDNFDTKALQADFASYSFANGITAVQVALATDAGGYERTAFVGLLNSSGWEIWTSAEPGFHAVESVISGYTGMAVYDYVGEFVPNDYNALMGAAGPDVVRMWLNGDEKVVGQYSSGDDWITTMDQEDWNNPVLEAEWNLVYPRPGTHVVEYIVWDKVLNDTEVAQVHAYLAARYPSLGITT